MPLSRTRTKTKYIPGGVVTDRYGNVLGTFTVLEEWQETKDWYMKKRREDGSLPPSDFDSDLRVVVPHRLSKNSGTFRFISLATAEGSYLPGVTPPLSVRGTSSRLSENAYYTQTLLAMTNPLRSDFSVPVFIKELVELPTLFKIAFNSLTEAVGSSYLAYRFGWTQFASDVRVLHKITKAIERRIREFDSLKKKGGLRRKVGLDSLGWSDSTPNVTIHSTYGEVVKATRTTQRSLKVWGSVRWRASPEFVAEIDKLSAFNLAVQQVFDLEAIDAETAWGLVPWSWLVDYFTNISDFLIANAGRGKVEPYDICIMRDIVCVDRYQVTSVTGGVTVSGSGKHVRRVRARDVTVPGDFPAGPIDLLSEGQWKIVLALFLTLGQRLR